MPLVSIFGQSGILRRFRRNQSGLAAVEFALIGPIFVALLLATAEVSLRFYADQVMETATADAARAVLTGHAQNLDLPACPAANPGCSPADRYKSHLCSQVPGGVLFDCNKFYVDIRSYQAFDQVQLDNHVDGTGAFVPNMQYNTGGPGDIVVVRVFYEWPTFINLLGFNLSNLANGKHLMVATAAFKNEPF